MTTSYSGECPFCDEWKYIALSYSKDYNIRAKCPDCNNFMTFTIDTLSSRQVKDIPVYKDTLE